ncbi:P-loop containing nucleoside triphosphate hydrolase protein [Schizothecium vesticola]|uniref:P-loop containing nucleoside triphosphate hydrolase protein n=1 Tax=Schizothecium vesticola TaxID=314040 RepID=A0AA40KA69_9PEZI|nr:P-loop containing nucleoside triphosphate hydrolase protein [Schizothecium vesticola]
MKMLEFKIRKALVTNDVDKRLQKRQPSRVYVNEEALIELTGSKDGGKLVYIEKVSSSPDEPSVRREATLWKAPEKLNKSVAQMYEAFREACDYKLETTVKITAAGVSLPDADEIVFEELSVRDEPLPPLPEQDVPHWEYFLSGRLSMMEHIYAGLGLRNIFVRGPERTFFVASVNGRPAGNARYLDGKTTVRIAPRLEPGSEGRGAATERLEITDIRGLDTQIQKLNDLLSLFANEKPYSFQAPRPNIVIHGGHGTGKTMLLDKIAASGWGAVFRIQFKDKLTDIQETFQRAKLQQPSIILIDELERLIDKDRNNRGAVILSIREALDSLAAETRLKGEPPKVLVVAACLDYTTDVPEELTEPFRFTSEVYLPLPDVQGRLAILASLGLHVDPSIEADLLRQLSERTHAYNGKDLQHPPPLLQPHSTHHHHHRPPSTPAPAPTFLPSDYESALAHIRPSAMHDINLKPPPIRWTDIGGQARVKTSLRRAVRLSTESPATLARFFDRPPKGFLLYGPPGCSKTMAAQAMATESGLNFFAVKGAELLNMYVGESERAVRRLFQRAREVAPSMIFFDEVDAIAGQRAGFGHGSGGGKQNGGGGGTGGVNVLTTLLNEMDGFEALQGVVVLAATNRPQALDPALLRPGRFDELIYVSPPDEAARRAIFEGVAAKRRMHADVDMERLARETEGCSGAEIKGICAVAGVAAYDRFAGLAEREEGVEGGEGKPEGIKMADLESAMASQKRQITKEMIDGFEAWERQFRRH